MKHEQAATAAGQRRYGEREESAATVSAATYLANGHHVSAAAAAFAEPRKKLIHTSPLSPSLSLAFLVQLGTGRVAALPTTTLDKSAAQRKREGRKEGRKEGRPNGATCACARPGL